MKQKDFSFSPNLHIWRWVLASCEQNLERLKKWWVHRICKYLILFHSEQYQNKRVQFKLILHSFTTLRAVEKTTRTTNFFWNHTNISRCTYMWAPLILLALYYKPLNPQTLSASYCSNHIFILCFCLWAMRFVWYFKRRIARFINKAELGRGSRFRDALLIFAPKLWSVSVFTCSAASEEKSSKLTSQVYRALVSVLLISGRKISQKNSRAYSCLLLCTLSELSDS